MRRTLVNRHSLMAFLGVGACLAAACEQRVLFGSGAQGDGSGATMGTGSAGSDLQSLCGDLCNFVQQECDPDPGCTANCLTSASAECLSPYQAFVACWVSHLTPLVCDPPESCWPSLTAWFECEGPPPPQCQETCMTEPGGGCGCEVDCGDVTYSTNCNVHEGTGTCFCDIDGEGGQECSLENGLLG